ncbi:hypothetical protein [Streptomyces sp. NPDC002851]
MADTTIKLDKEVRDRLAALAADCDMSLRGFLEHLARSRSTPAERQERSDRARAALAEHFGVHTTDRDVEEADAFVQRLVQERTQRRGAAV